MPRIVTDGRAAAAAWRAYSATRPGCLAVDTETTGVDWFDTPFCATASWRDEAGRIRSGYFDLADEQAARTLTLILESTPVWVGHNLKFDLQKLLLIGVIERPLLNSIELHDTEAQAHLLNPNERKGLKLLAKVILGEETDEEEKLKVVRRKLGLTKADGYEFIPRSILAPYALKDTEFTLRLHEKQLPRLEGRLLKLYHDEMRLTLELLDMEAAGYRLDVEYVKATAEEYGQRIMQHLSKIRELADDELLNPASPKQLLEAFHARGHKKLESTNEETLSKLDDEMAEAVLAFRGDKKLHTTYLKAMLDEQRDGIIHPSFRQHGTRTGRMSSGAATG